MNSNLRKRIIKKFFVLVLLFIFTVSNSLGSPLVFKITKDVTKIGLVEIGSFDAMKFKQIRLAVKISEREMVTSSKKYAEIELSLAKSDLTRKERLLLSGDVSRADYDSAVERVKIAQQAYDNNGTVSIFGVENGDEILLAEIEEGTANRTIIIDSPPSKISVKASGTGKYSVYVWGQ
jgi:hypothetical protein